MRQHAFESIPANALVHLVGRVSRVCGHRAQCDGLGQLIFVTLQGGRDHCVRISL